MIRFGLNNINTFGKQINGIGNKGVKNQMCTSRLSNLLLTKQLIFKCDLIENDFTLCVLTKTWIRQGWWCYASETFVHQGSNQYQYLGKTGLLEALQWSIRTHSLLDLGQHITTLQWNVTVFLQTFLGQPLICQSSIDHQAPVCQSLPQIFWIL